MSDIEDPLQPPAPYIHKHRVLWAETDTARIAYTAAFPQMGMEALERFFEDVLGENWFINGAERDRGNPFVHLSFDFHSSLTPRDTVHIVVWIEKVGASSMSFVVEGHVPPARKSFTARYTCVFVKASIRKPIRIPKETRTRAEAYQAACAQHPAPGAFSLDKLDQ